MNDEHVLAHIEAVDRTDLDTVHVLALDAEVGDDVGHAGSPGPSPFPSSFSWLVRASSPAATRRRTTRRRADPISTSMPFHRPPIRRTRFALKSVIRPAQTRTPQ